MCGHVTHNPSDIGHWKASVQLHRVPHGYVALNHRDVLPWFSLYGLVGLVILLGHSILVAHPEKHPLTEQCSSVWDAAGKEQLWLPCQGALQHGSQAVWVGGKAAAFCGACHVYLTTVWGFGNSWLWVTTPHSPVW